MDVNILLSIIFVILCIYLLGRYNQISRAYNQVNLEMFSLRREITFLRAKLELAETRLAGVTDSAFDGFMIVDHNHQIIVINQASYELFGLNPKWGASFQSTGKTVMTTSRNHELDELVKDSFDADEPIDTQITINDRALRVKALRLNPDSSTESAEVAVILHDVSELVRLTRARRDMVANFSHDLGTPISTIRLIVDMLQMNYGRNPDRDKAKLLELASTTDSLQHMTRELIDLSTIESGKAIIRMVEVPLVDILRNAMEMMTTQAEQKQIEIALNSPEGLRVLADPDQTRRVLTNLIHNALKFTPSGGKIVISAQLDDPMIIIRVKDTGQGIPPQERKRIFERFYQVDTARTGSAKVNGTGLGLSIAKHIVEAQGGKIWAEAGIPSGAVLCFTLPQAG